MLPEKTYTYQDILKFQKLVVNAAKEGKIKDIKRIIENVGSEYKRKITSGRLNNRTPLLACIRNGHIDIATYLIEQCDADVEETGSVTFDGEIIEEAPPLWCAAAAGYLDTVKLLLRHKADINKTTKTNSTPLRAACFDGRLEIVKYLVENGADIEIANRHGHTCLMIACYKNHHDISDYLIEHGADINRKSVKGNTALHDCAESGSLKILRQLLKKGAKQDVDSYGLTPLLTACVSGHTSIVDYLLMDSSNSDRKSDALKLLGATYVDKRRDIQSAIRLWRQAVSEQTKCATSHCSQRPVVSEYDNVTDLQTVEQLEELITDPDKIKMQALYIREQVLGPAHPDASYYIRYRGAVYADSGNFDKCINLWMYALKMQQKYLEPLNPMTQSSLISFAELFSFTLSSTWIESGRARINNGASIYKISFSHVLAILEYAVLEIRRGVEAFSHIPMGERDSSNLHRTMIITLHLVCLLCDLKKDAADDKVNEFMKLMYDLLKLDPRGRNGVTFLHLACHRDTSLVGRHPVCSFPSLDVVNTLLMVGASVTATDYDKNTCLHTAVFSRPVCGDIVSVLLDHGAHIDAINLNHHSPLQVLQKDSSININILNYLSLSCLAAQAISSNMLPYKNLISADLADFVQYH